MKKLTVTLLLITLPAINCFGYGSPGHRMIGRVADKRLAGTTTATKISTLLKGMTLARAATIPDEIKDLDQGGTFTLPAQFATIETQLKKFWAANKPSTSHFYHRNFHFTDVPVVGNEHYKPGVVGRSDVDIVHMINFCLGVLKGDIAETNPRKITKPVAIILISHYVGDIHQPLHVGAQYFDARGKPANPDQVPDALPDEGGNSLRLKLADAAPGRHSPKFHGFWDLDAVTANFPLLPNTMPKELRQEKMDLAEKSLTSRLAKVEPKSWQMPASMPVEDYPEAWANEILPIAREAHSRLQYEHIQPMVDHEQTVAGGEMVEPPNHKGESYREWAAHTVLEEMHKAGWRLADLLSKLLQP